jgi:hypothetical protein
MVFQKGLFGYSKRTLKNGRSNWTFWLFEKDFEKRLQKKDFLNG